MATPQETKPPFRFIDFVNADPKTRTEMLLDWAMPAVIDGADRILSHVQLQWEPGAKEAYINAKRQGSTILNISSHQTWLDALKLAQVAEEESILETEHGVTNGTKGNLITLAKSVPTGHQGKLLQKGYQEMERHFKRRGTKTVEYVRPEDEKFGLVPNGREVVKTLIKGVEESKSLSFFPEGSVEGGRTRLGDNEIENDLAEFVLAGQIKGMQRFDGDVFTQAIRIVERHGKQGLFMPVAIDGIYRLLKPRNDRNRRATLTLYSFLALGIPVDLGLVTTRVGMPLRIDAICEDLRLQGKEANGQNIADYVGYQIAKMMPAAAQGVYAQAA